MDEQDYQQTNITQETKINKVAVDLWAFMQQCGIKSSIRATPNAVLSYTFEANDMTQQGDAFGLSFILTSADIKDLGDDPTSVEQFCFQKTVEVGLQLLTEKATQLLRYAPQVQQSRIVIPGR